MPNICIIIPCYNEEFRLNESAFNQFLTEENSWSFIFVNDGSKDHTISVLERIKSECPERMEIIDLRSNSGKAEAVRIGINQALINNCYDYVGFLDADLSTPLSQLKILIENTVSKELVVGTRFKRLGATIERKSLRHLMGRIFASFASIMLHLDVYDTQCGAKILRSDLAGKVFKDKFISKWLFDVEIFARIIKIYGLGKTKEIAVEVPLLEWKEKEGSKIRIIHFVKAPFDLIRIYFHYLKKRSI